MNKILVSLICLMVLLLTACQEAQEVEGPSVKMEARLRLFTDDGQTIDKVIPVGSESGLENLGALVGSTSGRFVLIIETIRSNDSYTQEIEGNLLNGALEGTVGTYLVIDKQRHLVSEVTYKSDIQEGPIASYYPMSGRVQMRGVC
jgi:hypothetical protein